MLTLVTWWLLTLTHWQIACYAPGACTVPVVIPPGATVQVRAHLTGPGDWSVIRYAGRDYYAQLP